MSEAKPPIIRPPSDWELPRSIDEGREFPRRSSAAMASLVLAICAIFVAGVSMIPVVAPAAKLLAFLGPLALLMAVAALICGIVGLCTTGKKSCRKGHGLAWAGTMLSVLACGGGGLLTRTLLLAVAEAESRSVSANNMNQIGLALHNHHDVLRQFPPAGDEDFAEKEPAERYEARSSKIAGVSWRVHVLPFLDQQDLYEDINREESWDSPHNSRVLEAAEIETYQSPSFDDDPHKTVYLAVVTADRKDYRRGTAMERTRGIRLAQITDGPSKTIVVVEADADQAVPWPKPSDWQYDPQHPHRGLETLRPAGFLALLADGSVQFIPHTIDDTTLQRLFERSDGHVVVMPSGTPGR